MTRTSQACSTRHGMTLVELLMVISIMTILMVVAIPMVRPAFENRQLREAARQLNAFVAGAKFRAAELGRPMGVWIDTNAAISDPKFANHVYMAEVAPSYTGAEIGSRITIEFPAPGVPAAPRPSPPWHFEFDDEPLGTLHFWDSTGNVDSDTINLALIQSLVSSGELFYVQFDHKGRFYTCFNTGSALLISLPHGPPPGLEHPTSTPLPGSPPVGQTYEIMRGPTRSIVSPLVLPGDAVIDLSVSGVGVGNDADAFKVAASNSPIIIMFTSNGQVGSVIIDQVSYPPVGSIFLLIGRRAKVMVPSVGPALANPELSNLADPSNLWITINNRTGAITTEDNGATQGMPVATPVLDRIKAAREFARTSTQKGGQ